MMSKLPKVELLERLINKCDVVIIYDLLEELLQVSQTISQITPLELDILYVLVDLLKQTG